MIRLPVSPETLQTSPKFADKPLRNQTLRGFLLLVASTVADLWPDFSDITDAADSLAKTDTSFALEADQTYSLRKIINIKFLAHIHWGKKIILIPSMLLAYFPLDRREKARTLLSASRIFPFA